MKQALGKFKVLDFTRFVAGPFCTLILQSLGAEIIKVEIPVGGDASRSTPPMTKGSESHGFIILNRGKKSITLNLETAEGCEIAKKLAERVDVVVENFSPGVMDKLGLSYEVLSNINPLLIYASISGFGQSGPRMHQTAFDMVAQAMGGLMSITGFPDSPPTRASPSIADYMGGMNAAIAILAALLYRYESGEGQSIDISMQDGVWAVASELFPTYLQRGSANFRLGNGHVLWTPYGTYPAKDGYIVLAIVTVGQWQKLLKVIGREDLSDVPEYATQKDRVKYRDTIDAMVSEWTKVRTTTEILNALNNANLPCSSVPTFDEVVNDTQLKHRDMIVEVEQLVSGKVKVPGSVFKLSKTRGDPYPPASFLGQHNIEIYSSLLGYSEQQILKLQERSII